MRLPIIASISTAVAFAATGAGAQQTPEEQAATVTGPVLDTVTVKARKVEENIQSTPLAVTSIVQQVIDDARGKRC